MIKRIESRDNSMFRNIAALRQTRRSRESGLVFLEGSRLCSDALQSSAFAVQALFSDSGRQSPAVCAVLDGLSEKTEVISLTDRLFNQLCDTENPQGIALVCKSPLIDQPQAGPAQDGLYLVAEGIQDPGNLGAMIRTADAFAFDGVIVTDGTVYPYNDKVLRAAMGSCFHVPLLTLPDARAVAEWLAGSGGEIALLAANLDGDPDLPKDLPLPAALIIGNEGRGLTDDAIALSTHRIAIPMPGKAESLNASAAAAILCHAMMRRRFTLRGKVL